MLNAGRSGQASVDCEPAVRLAARPDALRIDRMFDRFKSFATGSARCQLGAMSTSGTVRSRFADTDARS
jgi:hypothetical protein